MKKKEIGKVKVESEEMRSRLTEIQLKFSKMKLTLDEELTRFELNSEELRLKADEMSELRIKDVKVQEEKYLKDINSLQTKISEQ